MPEQLTFNDTLTLAGSAGSTLLTGALDVTYGATSSVTGELTLGASGTFQEQIYQNISIVHIGVNKNGKPMYELLAANGVTSIAINYVGRAPVSFSVEVVGSFGLLASATGAPIGTTIVCFAEGTSIRTPRGEIPVERLSIGNKVVTASGTRVIRWIGNRKIDCRSHPEPRAVLPVRISTGAMGPGLPARDLYVSPGHGILVSVVDEVLMPASLLCNGSSVQQIEVDEVSYWHVELDSHDIVFSNGLKSESYIDVGNRDFFAGAADQGPDGERSVATLANYCRPYVVDEAVVRVVRQRLQARAERIGWAIDASPASDLRLEVGGKVLRPEYEDGVVARFVLPRGATDVWLCSHTSIPAFVLDTWDGRRLGVPLRALSVDDRRIAAGDPTLCVGFHPAEGEAADAFRWTNGRALLPAELWSGRGEMRLEVELAGPVPPRWTMPAERLALDVAA